MSLGVALAHNHYANVWDLNPIWQQGSETHRTTSLLLSYEKHEHTQPKDPGFLAPVEQWLPDPSRPRIRTGQLNCQVGTDS